MSGEMTAIAMGVHVLDVLVRPVEAIPEGQGGQLVEEIRVTAAGSAGGTAITLAKLGARVRSAGAIGTDAVGDMLIQLLERDGVDTSLLVRREDLQTSASVLPIRPNGDRPAFHVIGANQSYGPDDAPLDEIAAATHLHLGGPEFMGGEAAARDPRACARPGSRHLGRRARPRRSRSARVDRPGPRLLPLAQPPARPTISSRPTPSPSIRASPRRRHRRVVAVDVSSKPASPGHRSPLDARATRRPTTTNNGSVAARPPAAQPDRGKGRRRQPDQRVAAPGHRADTSSPPAPPQPAAAARNPVHISAHIRNHLHHTGLHAASSSLASRRHVQTGAEP